MRPARPTENRCTLAGIVAIAGIVALVVLPEAARAEPAEPLRFGPHDVASLFTISKSENKNEVVYAIHLDAQCAPIGDAPVFAFWRMFEKGAHVVAPLLSREEAAYGIGSQRVVATGSQGGRIALTLRALPSRPIQVEIKLWMGAAKHGLSSESLEQTPTSTTST